MDLRIGEVRYLVDPNTGKRSPASVILDDIRVPPLTQKPYHAGSWGDYVFGAHLEVDLEEKDLFLISFPYWRNGRFAGQYTLRAEPWIVKQLFDQMLKRGWFDSRKRRLRANHAVHADARKTTARV